MPINRCPDCGSEIIRVEEHGADVWSCVGRCWTTWRIRDVTDELERRATIPVRPTGRSDPGMTEEGFQRMVLGDKFYETGVDDD